jgi:tetratricopeptide (TPR) repeat protein
MSANLVATTEQCDLIRLERTNMVSKMEDRIKVDLAAMSKLILDHLRLCDPGSLAHTPELLSKLAIQFNQGSLVQYQYGEIERAETLCLREIELFARLSSCSTERALCLASMVAPYINLARIYGQKGDVQQSLSIFEEVYRFGLEQQDLSIFGHRIPVADAQAVFTASPGIRKVMLSCRVVETGRVLQTIEDYSALLALAETNEGLLEFQDAFFQQYLLEVRSRALLHMGRHEPAMEAFEKCCSQMPLNTTDRLVVHLLLSQIYREWGRNDLAGETLNKLEAHLAGLEHYGRRLPILRQIAYRLALECHLMGADSRALEPAEKAFKWCSELSDQPGSIKTAILLLRISSDRTQDTYSPAMQRHWHDELKRLASTTFFRLERACAYWELGLSAELMEADGDGSHDSACEFLQNSYDLYRSVPFVDSRQSCAAVKRTLDSWVEEFPVRRPLAREMVREKSSSIDSTFEALMEYAPEVFVASQ